MSKRKTKSVQQQSVALQPVAAKARRHRGPFVVTSMGAALGVGVGLTIVGGEAVLAEALMPGGILLSAGLACLGVSWKVSAAR